MPNDDRRLRQLDFTLLIIFDEVMSHRRLGAAAERLGLTESAVSHAVRRLSDLLDVQLFVRERRGVSPTPTALRIAPLIQLILGTGLRILDHSQML